MELLKYVQKTSSHLASLAELAGNVVPGFALAAKGLDALAKLDLNARGKTAAGLRGDIESRLDALGLTFIVVINDLDRLEPAQAVETLRLVRSVADFSRFRYVLCYESDVLAHAVQQGLGVQDGHQYLLKIVPLWFSLPCPEAFTSRRHFNEDALQINCDVHGTGPDRTRKPQPLLRGRPMSPARRWPRRVRYARPPAPFVSVPPAWRTTSGSRTSACCS